VADGGRIIYVESSTTPFPLPGYGLHGASKIVGQFLVEVLAKELGSRGVTVNSILPTAIEGGCRPAGRSVHAMEARSAFRDQCGLCALLYGHLSASNNNPAGSLIMFRLG
jgi:NAD(P)-dependent dehydrogenase (short-subunit alcohol dehydrogenase family)